MKIIKILKLYIKLKLKGYSTNDILRELAIKRLITFEKYEKYEKYIFNKIMKEEISMNKAQLNSLYGQFVKKEGNK